jgi:hypothetical protein
MASIEYAGCPDTRDSRLHEDLCPGLWLGNPNAKEAFGFPLTNSLPGNVRLTIPNKQNTIGVFVSQPAFPPHYDSIVFCKRATEFSIADTVVTCPLLPTAQLAGNTPRIVSVQPALVVSVRAIVDGGIEVS